MSVRTRSRRRALTRKKISAHVRRAALCQLVGEKVQLTFIEGYDEAVIGLVDQFGMAQPVVLYDISKIFNIIQREQHATRLQARAFFEEHIASLWVGEETPAFAFTV